MERKALKVCYSNVLIAFLYLELVIFILIFFSGSSQWLWKLWGNPFYQLLISPNYKKIGKYIYMVQRCMTIFIFMIW